MAPPAPWFPERLRDFYDRLLASPRFRQFATRFPLTRPMARRRVRALFDLCAGFVYTQTLLACVRLRVFEILRDGPVRTTRWWPGWGFRRKPRRRC